MIHKLPRTFRDDQRHAIRWLAVVIAAGVVARAVALALHPPLNPDEVRYLLTAHHLRSGAGYADWHGPEIDILPLHPLLTAASGADPGTLERRGRQVAFLASILGLPALAALAWQAAGPTEAILVVAIATPHPWLVPDATRPQAESLYVLFTLLGFLALARVRAGTRSKGPWALAGAFLGCAYLARPEGLFVAFAAGGLTTWHAARRRLALPGALFFAAALLLTILPYLLWLHGVTGRWAITGKSDKVFFIGQAMDASGGAPPTAEAYLALQREYGDWVTFVRRNPGAFLGRLFRMGRRMFGWVLPRALGPLGVLGLCALLIRGKPRDSGRPAPWWTIAPAIVLPLMLLTYPNECVTATAIPFLLIPVAVGLRRVSGQLRRALPVPAVPALELVLGLALLGLSWYPAGMRPVNGRELGGPRIEGRMAAEALALTNDPRAIATNSPVVAFHLHDPDLFGTPGTWRPLEPGLTCSALAGEMRRRGATVSVIERWSGGGSPLVPGPDCPITEVDRRDDAATGRRMEIVRLAP